MSKSRTAQFSKPACKQVENILFMLRTYLRTFASGDGGGGGDGGGREEVLGRLGEMEASLVEGLAKMKRMLREDVDDQKVRALL